MVIRLALPPAAAVLMLSARSTNSRSSGMSWQRGSSATQVDDRPGALGQLPAEIRVVAEPAHGACQVCRQHGVQDE